MDSKIKVETVAANQNRCDTVTLGKIQIRLARKAFYCLEFLNNKDWTHRRDRLFDLCKSDTASIADAAKLFAVKRIAEYLSGDKMPSGKDYLHMQKSCFYAAGLVDEYGEEIRKVWREAGFSGLRNLNYTSVEGRWFPVTGGGLGVLNCERFSFKRIFRAAIAKAEGQTNEN